jgi:hypothetical protein
MSFHFYEKRDCQQVDDMGLHVRYIMWVMCAGMDRLWTVGNLDGSAADEDCCVQEYQPWIQGDFMSMSTGNNAPRDGQVFFIFKQYREHGSMH